jgi:uncharacterized phage protein (TIGR01671 family)
MREILFRGKSILNEWKYGSLKRQALNGEPSIWAIQNWDDATGLYENHIDPTAVGQFTGLFDKNGKKIFEGDIIFVWYRENQMKNSSEVKFENGAFGIDVKGEFAPFWVSLDMCKFEVIGNIHDNPELLEVQNG